MQAKETKLQDILEGTKQYVVPLFQRTYSWDNKEWNVLWNDIEELYGTEAPKPHFIGSIVNMPTSSVPEGVSKFLLIDGQQRITTILLLLCLLRDKARENDEAEFAEEINNTLIANPYKKDLDYFKLLPTQVDRDIYSKIIRSQPVSNDSQVTKAYVYFERRLRNSAFELTKLKKIITNHLSIVSIVLDADDNPYLVFESLNAKGRPLSQADLIRNYFFMRIHVAQQERIYYEIWKPLYDSLRDNLTEYIRHYLMTDGSIVKQSDVYYTLKDKVDEKNALEYLNDLQKFASYYSKFVDPSLESDVKIRRMFLRLNRIEVTTAYPLLLNLYNMYDSKDINRESFVDMLKTIENFLIRRFVDGIPTNQLNKLFPAVFPQLISQYADNLSAGLKKILQSKGYPRDNAFKASLISKKLYGAADRAMKSKLILESLEEHYEHKEQVPLSNLTIEHIMPQTLSQWWQEHLGADWEVTHELLLHNIGNLTLTAYNPELSNDDFPSKKDLYRNSHLEINKYFEKVSVWNKQTIEERAEHLASIALKVWPYFGDEAYREELLEDVTGTSPRGFTLLDQYFEVNSWRDVLEETLNVISELEPDNFEDLIRQFPQIISRDKKRFRAVRELRNGYYVEVNLSARNIQQLCYQAIESIGLSTEDLIIDYEEVLQKPKSQRKKDVKFIPVNFHPKCIDNVEKKLNIKLDKITSSTYQSSDKRVGVICSVSKEHGEGIPRYWFAFHEKYKDFFSKYSKGYVVYGCGSENLIFMFPYENYIPLIENMNATERADLKYWHVKIKRQGEKYILAQPNYTNAIDISEYRI